MQPRVWLRLFTAGMPERPALVHNTAIQIIKKRVKEVRRGKEKAEESDGYANLPAGF